MSIDGLLDELLNLTEMSITLARNESWDELVENEGIRQAKVSKLEPLVDEMSEASTELNEKLTKLMALNETLATICSERRNELAQSLKQLSTGRQASKAYTD